MSAKCMQPFPGFRVPDYKLGVRTAGNEEIFSRDAGAEHTFYEVGVAADVSFTLAAGADVPGPDALVPAAGEENFRIEREGKGCEWGGGAGEVVVVCSVLEPQLTCKALYFLRSFVE